LIEPITIFGLISWIFSGLHVHGNRPLVAVEHREIERVGIRHVAQLAARRVALRVLELDHVRAHPGEELRAGGTGLDVRHVQNAYAFQSFHGLLLLRG
jgi:hypothetical protein